MMLRRTRSAVSPSTSLGVPSTRIARICVNVVLMPRTILPQARTEFFRKAMLSKKPRANSQLPNSRDCRAGRTIETRQTRTRTRIQSRIKEAQICRLTLEFKSNPAHRKTDLPLEIASSSG
jgi:hypothetical protein